MGRFHVTADSSHNSTSLRELPIVEPAGTDGPTNEDISRIMQWLDGYHKGVWTGVKPTAEGSLPSIHDPTVASANVSDYLSAWSNYIENSDDERSSGPLSAHPSSNTGQVGQPARFRSRSSRRSLDAGSKSSSPSVISFPQSIRAASHYSHNPTSTPSPSTMASIASRPSSSESSDSDCSFGCEGLGAVPNADAYKDLTRPVPAPIWDNHARGILAILAQERDSRHSSEGERSNEQLKHHRNNAFRDLIGNSRTPTSVKRQPGTFDWPSLERSLLDWSANFGTESIDNQHNSTCAFSDWSSPLSPSLRV